MIVRVYILMYPRVYKRLDLCIALDIEFGSVCYFTELRSFCVEEKCTVSYRFVQMLAT